MIDAKTFWVVIFFLSLGTYTTRVFFLLLSDRIRIPESLKKLFSYIPAAVLPALITPMVVFHQGSLELLAEYERPLVMVFATLVCFWSKSMVVTVGFGLTALYVLNLFLH